MLCCVWHNSEAKFLNLFHLDFALITALKIMHFTFSFSFSPSFSPLVNTHPPALQINGSLLIPLGGFAPLPQTLLQVKDPDSPSERLIFQLVQGPSNGQLYLFKREEGEEREGHEMSGRELARDDTFTWEDLRTGRVRFRHQKDQTRSVSDVV